ncbi:unnamed protein product [Macrosiphum euphorbiae]|uniref:Uncharacterized protein n=1 Tax=Macrosiphum euphorbiae TaxID=13131 RepID=A0AAV0Y727_9HEMI|nr:unnamed protein product [Macrosiphum euphorbiae]
MDKSWVEHNGTLEAIYKSAIETNMTREYIIDKIIGKEDTVIPPKTIANIKFKTYMGTINKQLTIHPVDRLSQNQYLKLEKNIVDKNIEEIQVYNFSNLYTRIYEGTIIGTIEYKKKDSLLIINETSKDITDRQGTVIKISNDLTNKQREKATLLISKYQYLFTSEQLELNCAKVEECEVNLDSKDTVFQAPYRVSPKQREKLKNIIDEMTRADIIEPSKSSYAAPVFIIPKKQKGESFLSGFY